MFLDLHVRVEKKIKKIRWRISM